MNKIEVSIIGTRPLLMHADTFVDARKDVTKEHKAITGKRKKTDEDLDAIAQSEWRGGMYHDDAIGPYMPDVNILASLQEGAKMSKLGKIIERGVMVSAIDGSDKCPLIYDGPRDLQSLWEQGYYDGRSVRVSMARVVRYRPMFRQWALECAIDFHADLINRDQVIRCLEDAGAFCGLGDYRKRFGRYRVEVKG